MAENVVINFEANTQGLIPAVTILEKLGQIDKATADTFRKQTSEYQQQLSQRAAATTTAFEKLKTAVNGVKVDNGLAKALDQSAPVLKTANSVSSLRQQVRQAVQEAQNLAAAYGDLDPRAIAAARSAARLKDQLSDVNSRINALNPEVKFQAISGLASGIAGAFTAAQGALGLFGEKSDDVQKALLKVQSALAFSQGINQVLSLKDAFVNLNAILGITAKSSTDLVNNALKTTNVLSSASLATDDFTSATSELFNTTTNGLKDFKVYVDGQKALKESVKQGGEALDKYISGIKIATDGTDQASNAVRGFGAALNVSALAAAVVVISALSIAFSAAGDAAKESKKRLEELRDIKDDL